MTSSRNKTKTQSNISDKDSEFSADFKRWRSEWDEKVRKREEEWGRVWARVVQASKKLGCYAEHEKECNEDAFAAALKKRGKIGNVTLKEVRRLKHRYEYPLVGLNNKEVVVGDFKDTMGVAEITEFADKKLPYFTEDFPAYSSRKIYGMVCAKHFTPAARHEAKKRNLFALGLKNEILIVHNKASNAPVASG